MKNFYLDEKVHTLTFFKPHLNEGEIINILEKISEGGFNIILFKKFSLNDSQWREFYQNIKDKPFFQEMIDGLSNKQLFAAVLEIRDKNQDSAIKVFRNLIGNTNPKESSQNTIRYLFGKSISQNAVHGSFCPDSLFNEFNIIFCKNGR